MTGALATAHPHLDEMNLLEASEMEQGNSGHIGYAPASSVAPLA